MSYEEGRRPLRCCERDVWDPNWQPLYGHSPACPSAPGTPADRLRALNDGRVWWGLAWTMTAHVSDDGRNIGKAQSSKIKPAITDAEWQVICGRVLPPFSLPPSLTWAEALPLFVVRLRGNT